MNRKQIKRVRNTLRKISSQVLRSEAFKRVEKKKISCVSKGKRKMLMHYRCGKCLGWFRAEKLELDHIDEVGEFRILGPTRNTKYGDCRIDNLGEWFDRLFCALDNTELLCKSCHQAKTLDFNDHVRKGGHLL